MDFIGFLSGLLQAISKALGLAQQNRDQTTGAELQKGADAEATLEQTKAAIAARDAVVPDTRGPDGSYRLPDGSRDPLQRD